jgi:glycosyltransferase EpsJ
MEEVKNTHSSDKELVSIIVPVYNSEKYLHLCVESIINQSYKNIELLLIDDGSTDNSGSICDAYASGDSRMRVLHTTNKGPAAARNIGIENSKGGFIFFIDSDDSIENNALNLLIKHYKQHNADMVIGDFKKIKEGVSGSGHNAVFSGNKLLKKQDIIDYVRCYLKKPNRFPLFVYSWGRLFKSSIIKNNNIFFNPGLRTFEDVAFNFDYLNHTEQIFFLNEAIYNHLIQDNYISATMMIGNNPGNLFGYKQALVSMANFLNNSNSGADIKREVGHADVTYTIIQLVRTCGQLDNSNKKKIYGFVREMINDPDFRNNLRFYSPTKGDSRIIPFLMKWKLVWLIMLVCRYKAYKRYRKRGAAR